MDALRPFSIRRVSDSEVERITDQVAAEEPLAILIQHWQKDAQVVTSLAVTMRTPGFEKELAAGLLLGEGIIQSAGDVEAVRALGEGAPNEVLVELRKGIDFEAWRTARNGFVSSSCGVCGKRTRDAIAQDLPPARPWDGFRISKEAVRALPAMLRARQPGFAETGGLHAAALADRSGQIEAAFEDIGRHNALDKLVGWAVLSNRLPLNKCIVVMSSRASFELVQKVAMAGGPVVATVGGPSSLAVETARDLQMTLIGFLRAERFNVYSGEWRVES